MTGKSLRVLHVLAELRPSGAESMLAAAAPEFARRGVSAEILSTGDAPGPFARELSAAGYRIHHVPFSKSVGFFLKLRRLIRGRYDVVHIHMERANFWVALTALISGTPTVLRTIHGSFAFAGTLRLRRSAQRRVLHWLGVRHIAVGRSVQESERQLCRCVRDVIPNWYDSNRFVAPDPGARRRARAALGIGEHDVVVASVGNCAPVKNHGAIVEALALLPAAARPLYLHVGIEEPGQPERALAEKLGVSERIRFLGGLEDPRQALYAADAFVMASVREGFGIAAVEAMAVGLPLIATDVPGLKDFRDRFSGIIYAKPEPRSLADALLELLALSAEDRTRLARDYPATALEAYGIESGVTRYLDVYASR